jgi:hypothetical protein
LLPEVLQLAINVSSSIHSSGLSSFSSFSRIISIICSSNSCNFSGFRGFRSFGSSCSNMSKINRKPVPWYLVQQAVDGALRARLVELDANSASWPCDPSAAAKVLLKAVTGAATGKNGAAASDTANYNMTAIRAYLQPNELQDLADALSSIMDLQPKHGIKIRFNLAVEVTADSGLKPEATAELRKALDDISDAFH